MEPGQQQTNQEVVPPNRQGTGQSRARIPSHFFSVWKCIVQFLGEAGAYPGSSLCPRRRGCAMPPVGKRDTAGRIEAGLHSDQGGWPKWPQSLLETVKVFTLVGIYPQNYEMLRA